MLIFQHVPELAGNELILETIIKLIRDDDAETRRNAAIALFNVACADQNTVKLVRYKGGVILEVLMHCVYPDDGNLPGSKINETNDDVSVNAAEALFNISCSSIEETTDRMAQHPRLLETLALTLRSPVASREVKLYCAATLRRYVECILLQFIISFTKLIFTSVYALLTGLARLSMHQKGVN